MGASLILSVFSKVEIRRACVFLACSLFLSSCITMSKQEQTENLLSVPSLTESVKEALRGGDFTLGDWPEEKWWATFHSKELDNLIEEALEDNPSIQSVKERVEKAKQESYISQSRLFPFIFFDADENWGWLSKNGLYHSLNPSRSQAINLIDLSLGFNYDFDFWGKYLNLYRLALGMELSAKAEEKQVELMISTALAQSFFALKANLYRRDLYVQLENVRKKAYILQQLLQQKALLSKLVPSLGDERLLEASKNVAAIEAEIKIDYHVINALRGLGPDAKLDVKNNFKDLTDRMILPEKLSIDLLARRPDLMAAIWQVEALSHGVSAAIADFLPDINLKGFAGLQSLGFSSLFKEASATGSLMPALHLPIFTAGELRANVKAKRARFNEAVYSYNELVLQAVKEVADLLALLESIYEKKRYQNEILDCADFRFNLVTLNFKKGLDDLLQVYTKEEEWIERALENAELIYSQYMASIKLIKALGGGYDATTPWEKNDGK